MRFATVCSGIEAPSVAWDPLGFSPVFFSEIEPFPCAVLSHRFPSVPNLGDMLAFRSWPDAAFDVLVGGTPCQSFSVAGLRKGLDDPRGNLALTYLAIAERYRPRWLVWENVPGVLSADAGRAFGSFVGGLGELGYGYAWRVLDAQYFGLAQRRRRVFVVASARGWQRAAAVLFERSSLRGDPAPRREAWKDVAPTISARTTGGGGLGTDFDLDGGLIAHALRAEGFDASEDGTGRGTPLVPICFDETQITHPENRSNPKPGDPAPQLSASARPPTIAFDCKRTVYSVGEDVAPTLRAMGFDGSHANGGGQIAIAFQDRFRGDDGRGYDRAPPMSVEQVGTLETVKHWNVATQYAVRRLTPRECERLQGFPDDYTLIPYRGKPAADGPRYKALGNSIAVPCLRWIGERLAFVDTL